MDWWAFGVLLYEMMAGQQPFEGDTDSAIFKNVKEKKAVFPKHFTQESMDVITSVSVSCEYYYKFVFKHINIFLSFWLKNLITAWELVDLPVPRYKLIHSFRVLIGRQQLIWIG